jgi:hypothetical protein
MGESQSCILDSAIYYRWLKRSPGEIQAAIDRDKKHINILRKALRRAKIRGGECLI